MFRVAVGNNKPVVRHHRRAERDGRQESLEVGDQSLELLTGDVLADALGQGRSQAEGDEDLLQQCDHTVMIPETDAMLYPVLATIPLQLIAYHAAVLRGCDWCAIAML